MNLLFIEMHGALTHFPVAMLIAAALFDIGSALFRKPEWRIVSFWLLVTAVVGSVPSLISGWLTGNEMFTGTADPPHIFVLHRTAAFVTSGLAVILLAWRIVAKDKLSGAAFGASALLALIAAGAVSYTGYLGGSMAIGSSSADIRQTVATNTPVDPKLIVQGKLVYQQNHCFGCHRIDGQGGAGGPDLTHEASRNPDVMWQTSHLKDPKKMRPTSFMPSYASLSADKLDALAHYLVSLK